MLSMEEFRTIAGRKLVGQDGEKIGKIDQLYADAEGGSPTFVTVETGLFGAKTTFVPVGDASLDGEDVTVPYTKDQVKDAPNLDPDGELSAEEEDRLYEHYGIGTGQAQADTEVTSGGGMAGATTDSAAGGAAAGGAAAGGAAAGTTGGAHAEDDRGTVGHDVSGPTTDSAMTRSEEQLRVGTEKVQTGRARLRKYVVTENVTQSVPVSREEVRVEREPITDANAPAAQDGPAISEEEHEVVLTEERPVVQKEAVPVERVRVDKETVTGEEQISDEVRKEQIDLDTGTEADQRR
jgi:uncharacterized protein (TIGR02271 family)